MTKLIPLTKRKTKWAQSRSNVALRGTRLQYNASQQVKYTTALNKLVMQMTEEVKKQVTRLFNGEIADDFFEQQEQIAAMDDRIRHKDIKGSRKDKNNVTMDASISSQARVLMNALTRKFTQLFNSKSKPLAESMVLGAASASKSNLHTSLKELSGGLSLKTGVVPEGMQDVATASVAENVSLIKSIPQQYFKDITGSVMRSITTGQGLADLVPDLNKYAGQTSRRVKNLALDQTRKAYNSINKQRMQSIGVKQFEWIHSGGSQKPRESHMKISGHIFSFETLYQEQEALGVPKEDQGIPGQAINCKCTMLPVVKFEE